MHAHNTQRARAFTTINYRECCLCFCCCCLFHFFACAVDRFFLRFSEHPANLRRTRARTKRMRRTYSPAQHAHLQRSFMHQTPTQIQCAQASCEINVTQTPYTIPDARVFRRARDVNTMKRGTHTARVRTREHERENTRNVRHTDTTNDRFARQQTRN